MNVLCHGFSNGISATAAKQRNIPHVRSFRPPQSVQPIWYHSGMRHRLFTALSVLSLAMCVFALTVWLLSFFSFAPIGQYWTTSWDGNGSGWAGNGWIAVNGSLHLLRDEHNVAPAPTSVAAHYSHSGIDPVPGVQPRHTHWGFARVDRVSAWRERETGRRMLEITQQISFPAWLPSPLFAILPALWLRSAMRRRRLRSAGLCPACGYNLTGNVSGVCPECGTRFSPEKVDLRP